MENVHTQLVGMLKTVALALGEDLRKRTAFVGGCTTSLFLTDEYAKEDVRYTDDVDLIIDIIGYAEWAELQEQLRHKGFSESMDENVICRMRLGGLNVDFMPDNADILGFSNRWYSKGLATAQNIDLGDELTIRILTPPLFLATKLEAWLGRGENDPLGSHDLEDILILIDGREEIVSEIKNCDDDIRYYITHEIGKLLKHRDIEHAVQGNFRGVSGADVDRSNLVLERLEELAAIT